MSLATLIREEGSMQPARVAFMSGMAGLASAGVLAIINSAAESVERHGSVIGYFFAFVGIVVVYVIAKQFILRTAIKETEQIVHRIRVRIIDKVIRSDLLPLEQIGRANIFAAAGKETQTISQAAFLLTNAAESMMMLVFAVIYLAYLSLPAFFIGTAFTGLAVAIHLRKMRSIYGGLREAMDQENLCLEGLTDFLSGFKEAKVNSARAADLQRYFVAQSSLAAEKKVTTQTAMAGHFTMTQVMFYMLIATMVFVVPIFSEEFAGSVVKTATAVLFMFGAITGIVSSVPVLAQANAAAGKIRDIEDALERSSKPALPTREPIRAFREIAFRNVVFQHHDTHANASFTVGPINLVLRAGEMAFVTGGNGSGKTTLIRLLVGLYRPTTGTIEVDGKVVDEQNLGAYRDMFSAVFSDFYLFKRLFGLMDAAQTQIDALLRRLEIEDKTSVTDGTFETLDLSGGQRKRIALLVAMLEDKPIVVLDEWAADQDPVFRKKFYEELLPELKRQGKTIIAITHDDHYFQVADRQLKMEYGQLVIDEGTRRV